MDEQRPKWSITWLLRIQRMGRDRRERAADSTAGEAQRTPAFKWFAWSIVLLLALEIAIGVWLGVLPRGGTP